MKLTARRLFVGSALLWIVAACLVLYSCHPVPAHAAQENCVTSKDSFGTTTVQCIDGTVTVTKGSTVIICAKRDSETVCQKMSI